MSGDLLSEQLSSSPFFKFRLCGEKLSCRELPWVKLFPRKLRSKVFCLESRSESDSPDGIPRQMEFLARWNSLPHVVGT